MTTLTNSDWQRLNEFLKSLYAPYSLEVFPIEFMESLTRIVRSDSSGVISFSLDNESFPGMIIFPDALASVAASDFAMKPKDFFAQPIASHYLKTFDGKTFAISDFLSEVEFHRQDLPYKAYLRFLGIEDQMGFFVELSCQLNVLQNVDLFHQKKDRFALMLSRDRRSFTERDRLVLNLIRPHLQQAYEQLVAFHQVHQHLAQQRAAMDLVGLIALSTDGKVQWITRRAGEILHRYFPPSSVPMVLPDLLQQWVERHLIMFSQREESCKLVRPLKLQQERQRLTIRLSYCPNDEQLYLLLEETKQESISIESLQLLGLTKREAEVLFWVAKDKSLVEIGKLLGMSDRTAKKHLEHIYEKFGVQTRLSAVMYALEHLGIFS